MRAYGNNFTGNFLDAFSLKCKNLHNVIAVSTSETAYEFLVSGFSEDEISIDFDSGTLTVKTSKNNSDIANYLYKGFNTYPGITKVQLAKHVKILKAELCDGILSVFVNGGYIKEQIRNIPITRGERTYLTERDDII